MLQETHPSVSLTSDQSVLWVCYSQSHASVTTLMERCIYRKCACSRNSLLLPAGRQGSDCWTATHPRTSWPGPRPLVDLTHLSGNMCSPQKWCTRSRCCRCMLL